MRDERPLIPAQYMVGAIFHGRVAGLANFGAFIDLSDGTRGLILIPDFPRGTRHPSEVLQLGQSVQVQVFRIDSLRRALRLVLATPPAAAEQIEQNRQTEP